LGKTTNETKNNIHLQYVNLTCPLSQQNYIGKLQWPILKNLTILSRKALTGKKYQWFCYGLFSNCT